MERLKPQLKPYQPEEQAGVGKDRNAILQILKLRVVAKTSMEKGNKVYSWLVDSQKAFDTIKQSVIWAVSSSYGVQAKFITVHH